MGIYHGTTAISALKAGSVDIPKLYVGSGLVFSASGGGSSLGVESPPGVEPTNYAADSNDFGGASWGGATSLLQLDVAAAPDTTTTADRIVGSRYQTVGPIPTLSRKVRCWVKSNTGGSQLFRFICTEAGVLDHWSPDYTATGTWQHFAFTQAFGSTANNTIAGIWNKTAGGDSDLLVWGFRVNAV